MRMRIVLAWDIGTSSSRLQDSDESGSRKVSQKPRGLDGVVEHVSIALITSFQYTSSWLVSCDTLLKHLCQSFGFARADSYKHVEHVKPFFTAPFDVLGIDILTRETVFKEVGGVVGGVRLSLSLFPPFFPHCLLAFFARRHQWPRAWQGLIQEAGNGLLTNTRTSLALSPAVTFAFKFRPCQPLLLAYSWASFGSKLFKIHATILTLRNETIVSIRESNAVSLEKIIWKSLSDHWSNSIRGTEKKRVKFCQLVSTYTNGFMSFTFHPTSFHPLPSFRTRLVFVQKPIKTWRVNSVSSNNSKGRFFLGTKRGRLFEGGD